MNERKYRELIKYIAVKSANDEWFGRTKLNKILFYCDFLAYRDIGESITGDGYHKKPFGPVPNSIRDMTARMIKDGELAETIKSLYGRDQKRVSALITPNVSDFTSQEIACIDDVLEKLKQKNATEVSDLSHQFIGWQVAEVNEDIPYENVLISREPLSQDEIDATEDIGEYAREILASG